MSELDCKICEAPVDTQQAGALVVYPDGADGERFAYCPRHAEKARPKKKRPTRRFSLRKAERASIFNGCKPTIERDPSEAKLLEPGEKVTLSSRVWITVTRRGQNKRGKVQYRYDIHDQREDSVRLLRQSPPAHRAEDDKPGAALDPETERQAAQESAYTSARKSAMPNEQEAVEEKWLKRFSEQAKERRVTSVRIAIIGGDEG